MVTRDVPDHCIVAGNPAQIIRTGIRTKAFGMLDTNPYGAPRHEMAREAMAEK